MRYAVKKNHIDLNLNTTYIYESNNIIDRLFWNRHSVSALTRMNNKWIWGQNISLTCTRYHARGLSITKRFYQAETHFLVNYTRPDVDVAPLWQTCDWSIIHIEIIYNYSNICNFFVAYNNQNVSLPIQRIP